MEADTLVQQAQDLARRGQTDEARALLRRAASLAPLRTDIRELLQQINDQAQFRPGRPAGAPRPTPPAPPPPAAAIQPLRPAPPADSPQEYHPEIPLSSHPGARHPLGGGAIPGSGRPATSKTDLRYPQDFYTAQPRANSSWIWLWVGVAVMLVALTTIAAFLLQKYLPVQPPPLPGTKEKPLGAATGLPKEPVGTPESKPAAADPMEQKRQALRMNMEALTRDGKFDDALKTLDAILQTNPPNPEIYQKDRAKIRFESGMAKYKRMEYKLALEDFIEAARLTPDDFDTQYHTGYVYYLTGRGETTAREKKKSFLAALEYLNKAKNVQPRNVRQTIQCDDSLAHVHIGLSDPVAAANCRREIIRLAPPDSPESKKAKSDLENMGMKVNDNPTRSK